MATDEIVQNIKNTQTMLFVEIVSVQSDTNDGNDPTLVKIRYQSPNDQLKTLRKHLSNTSLYCWMMEVPYQHIL